MFYHLLFASVTTEFHRVQPKGVPLSKRLYDPVEPLTSSTEPVEVTELDADIYQTEE